ncbi:MAG: restriction endonuclease subunit S [Candidatus Nitrotoga sp.]
MKFVKLGDVARIVCGGELDPSRSSCWNGTIPWVTAKDICGARINDSLERITEFGLKESASNLLPVGSIIMPASMAPQNVVINDVPVAIGKDLKAVIVDSSDIDRNYIQQFLLSKTSHLEYSSKKETEIEHATEILADIDIPLPPLGEQRRIAQILDKAHTICKKRRATIKLADDFLNIIFSDMFGDPVTNPKKWPKCPLKLLAERIQVGPVGTLPQFEELMKDEVSVKNQEYIINGELHCNYSTTDMKEKHAQLINYPLQTGDVVVGWKGEMGRCTVVTKDKNYLCGPENVFMRPDTLVIEAVYLARVLSGDLAKASFVRMFQGAQNLNEILVGNFYVPTPPINLQKQYLQIHNKMASIKEKLVNELVQSNFLFKRLAASAFRVSEAA